MQVYVFDERASTWMETAIYSIATIALPWQLNELNEKLDPRPVNSYLGVISADPVSGQVNVNDPHLLVQRRDRHSSNARDCGDPSR